MFYYGTVYYQLTRVLRHEAMQRGVSNQQLLFTDPFPADSHLRFKVCGRIASNRSLWDISDLFWIAVSQCRPG